MYTRTGGVWVYEYKGLSTDEKPVSAEGKRIPNGSSFFEMDTAKVFQYDEENGVWLEV